DLEQQNAVAKDRAELAKRQLAEVEAADGDLKGRMSLIDRGQSNVLNKRSPKPKPKKSPASRRTHSAATSARAWSNWPNRVTPRKSARPKHSLRKRQTPGAARWPTHEFSASKSNGIRRGTAFSLPTARATRPTPSSNAIGSRYAVK